jgi:hypothetical protein
MILEKKRETNKRKKISLLEQYAVVMENKYGKRQ